MATDPNSIDDSHWPEVENINSYALLIGYLQMAVRMLGVLMLAWATVVLLGGFFSKLHNKDFWCLAAITLIQTARVFDFFLKEKTRAVRDSWRGLQTVVKTCTFLMRLRRSRPSSAKKKKRRAGQCMTTCCCVLWLVPAFLVMAAISFAILFYLGPLVSLGVSLKRVRSVGGEYGGGGSEHACARAPAACAPAAADKDEKQVEPALLVLYRLGVVQGCFLLYRVVLDRRFLGLAAILRTRLAEQVAGDYRLDARIVSKYLKKTVTGCKKHPSFAKGRNLVTYGVDLLLMEPTSTSTTTSSSTSSSSRSRSCSRKHYLSGLAILGTILQQDDDDDTNATRPCRLHGQPTMMKHLLTSSASFGQVINRLLETLGPACPYSGAVRQRTARVLEEVAGSVRLEEFPGATQCLASVLGTFDEHCWRPEGYERDGDLPSGGGRNKT